MKFELLHGVYEDLAGVVFKKGDFVESEVDLEKKWVNKFRKVYPASGEPAAADVDKAVDAKLAALAATSPELAKALEADKAKAAAAKGAATALAARGTDVTDKFPKTKAHQEGFKVFQRGELFHVYVGDGTSPLFPKGLKADAVDAAVEKYLG